MNLTERDRKIAVALIPLVVVFAYWFLLLGPKRNEASAVSETLATEQARLTDAETRASTLTAAKSNFASDYAAVVRLGKAVPASVDMPSLLVQLEQAAKGTGIVFEKLTVGVRGPVENAPAAAPAGGAPDPAAPVPADGAPAPSGEAPASAPGQAAATAQDAASTASTPPPTADPAAQPAAGGAAPAPPAALESVPLNFTFKGSFFELANLFHKLKRFVYVDGDKVRVRGRLMTIDSVTYATDPTTFPSLSAEVTASVFLSPQAEGVAAGATPSGPAPATPPPATSTASNDGTVPPPTATATP